MNMKSTGSTGCATRQSIRESERRFGVAAGGINMERAMTGPAFKLLHFAMQAQAEIGLILYTTRDGNNNLGIGGHPPGKLCDFQRNPRGNSEFVAAKDRIAVEPQPNDGNASGMMGWGMGDKARNSNYSPANHSPAQIFTKMHDSDGLQRKDRKKQA